MTPAEQLRAAKALIDTPARWTKLATARDILGSYAHWSSPRAACFCSSGAVKKATFNPVLVGSLLNQCIPASIDRGRLGERYSYIDYNDRDATTHADIMKLFDDAIALAEAAQ